MPVLAYHCRSSVVQASCCAQQYSIISAAMQNFAAPFEPESLPAVAVEEWQALLEQPLLQQLRSAEALVLAVTEDAAGDGRLFQLCYCLRCL